MQVKPGFLSAPSTAFFLRLQTRLVCCDFWKPGLEDTFKEPYFPGIIWVLCIPTEGESLPTTQWGLYRASL